MGSILYHMEESGVCVCVCAQVARKLHNFDKVKEHSKLCVCVYTVWTHTHVYTGMEVKRLSES